MAVSSVFLQKKGLGPLGVKIKNYVKIQVLIFKMPMGLAMSFKG